MPTRLATANVRKDLRGDDVNHAVDAAFPAAIVCWQEVESREHIAAIEQHPDVDTYWPGGRYRLGRRKGTPRLNARNATPISWATDYYRLRRGHWRLAIPGIARVSPSRYTVWVVLDGLGRRDACVLSVHTVSGIAKASRSAAHRQWGGRTRRAVWRHHMSQIRRVTRRLRKLHPRALVGGGGDLNHAARLTSAYLGATPHYATKPTHGRSWYDLVWTDAQVLEMHRRTATPSDHDVLVAVIEED